MLRESLNKPLPTPEQHRPYSLLNKLLPAPSHCRSNAPLARVPPSHPNSVTENANKKVASHEVTTGSPSMLRRPGLTSVSDHYSSSFQPPYLRTIKHPIRHSAPSGRTHAILVEKDHEQPRNSRDGSAIESRDVTSCSEVEEDTYHSLPLANDPAIATHFQHSSTSIKSIHRTSHYGIEVYEDPEAREVIMGMDHAHNGRSMLQSPLGHTSNLPARVKLQPDTKFRSVENSLAPSAAGPSISSNAAIPVVNSNNMPNDLPKPRERRAKKIGERELDNMRHQNAQNTYHNAGITPPTRAVHLPPRTSSLPATPIRSCGKLQAEQHILNAVEKRVSEATCADPYLKQQNPKVDKPFTTGKRLIQSQSDVHTAQHTSKTSALSEGLPIMRDMSTHAAKATQSLFSRNTTSSAARANKALFGYAQPRSPSKTTPAVPKAGTMASIKKLTKDIRTRATAILPVSRKQERKKKVIMHENTHLVDEEPIVNTRETGPLYASSTLTNIYINSGIQYSPHETVVADAQAGLVSTSINASSEQSVKDVKASQVSITGSMVHPYIAHESDIDSTFTPSEANKDTGGDTFRQKENVGQIPVFENEVNHPAGSLVGQCIVSDPLVYLAANEKYPIDAVPRSRDGPSPFQACDTVAVQESQNEPNTCATLAEGIKYLLSDAERTYSILLKMASSTIDLGLQRRIITATVDIAESILAAKEAGIEAARAEHAATKSTVKASRLAGEYGRRFGAL